ncbi:zinc finger and BTB domain-containing protein 21 [Oryzias latipes]|nr:zinc finger and BTB domain-containing protein 21 [Oryzias latipes]
MESLVHYSNHCHALSMLGVLNEQRLQGQMCDVVLVVADQRYQAHKSVLAGSSEYFQSLFTRMDAESLKVVNLDFCEPDAFEIVLNYIYSSSLFVDKGSLAAIQELGYSLGIPFLTNITSIRPHASYCVSRKRFSFSEGEDNDVHTRSVIVCRVQNDTTHPSHLNHQGKSSEKPFSLHSSSEPTQLTSKHHSHEPTRSFESGRKSSDQSKESEKTSSCPSAAMLKGNSAHISPVRPLLTSSVSFSGAEVSHIRMESGMEQEAKEEKPESCFQNKGPFPSQANELSHTIDRSGPLIKSLLRRSLSMDSPVPVFSPTLELKEMQNREQSVVKMASKSTGSETYSHNGNSTRISPLVLRSKHPNRYDKETQVEEDIGVKAEPSSPLADPMDIVRITVGDALPFNLRDIQTGYDQGIRADFTPPLKRRDRPDNRRYPFKKSKLFKDLALSLDVNMAGTAPQHASADSSEGSTEPVQNKIFKCWNCLKVFRSSAGLHRHVNMYHNPEKPYACEICHKRFHTNFKVWTHCQTQHGVVQNPASSSSSTVLDEKFQKKLIDIVRDREIKKALLWKLKRNKQGLQSPSFTKKRSRSSFICPYCGKAFAFHSQYRQHLRTHPAEKADQDLGSQRIFYQEEINQRNPPEAGDYSCRLCNMKLPSLVEQGDHERGCRHATVCPYCGLRFSSPDVKKDHEAHCKYKKLTCLECMRTFKSSFSIWRHQVEVHNHNMMTVRDQIHLKQQEDSEEAPEMLKEDKYSCEPAVTGTFGENITYDSSGPPMYDSEDSSPYVPEDLSMGHHGKLVVKEEPLEESVNERNSTEPAKASADEVGVWPCEKCATLFSSRKDLERHQELLCHIKPFICHICNKAFRTNFRLWSHFQSHMSAGSEPGSNEVEPRAPSQSPSPPLTPQASERPSPQASVLKSALSAVLAAAAEGSSSPEACSSAPTTAKRMELEASSPSPLSRSNSLENPSGNHEADTLFYHAPSLSALTFKRQYMCKLCHRTFKTAFSLWSHEQSHSHV